MKPWEANIRKVLPYVPGEQPTGSGLIKLNTNENPYPPAPGVARALKELDYDQFRKYPDPTSSLLLDALAECHGVAPEQVFVGVGSDDVIAMSFLTFFHSKKPILFPDVTYSFYEVWANLYRIPYETPALDENFKIRKEDYRKENGGILFPNPNAPTGLYMPLSEIEEILQDNPNVVVIIDEAYIDFGGESACKLLNQYQNLLVVQTFSKSRSMAGMRIGFAIGHPDLICALNNVKYSYNSYTMSLASQILGAESVKDNDYFESTLKRIIETREKTKLRLSKLGFSFPDSLTNFIFAVHESCPAEQIFEALRREKIVVRYFKKPRIDRYLRISIGTDEEMNILCDFLEKYLREYLNMKS